VLRYGSIAEWDKLYHVGVGKVSARSQGYFINSRGEYTRCADLQTNGVGLHCEERFQFSPCYKHKATIHILHLDDEGSRVKRVKHFSMKQICEVCL
jgi:hypothetical protein